MIRLLGRIGLVAGIVGVAATAPALAQQQTPPQRQQPQQPQTQGGNWSGPQFGGFGGGSQMPVNFVEPGAFLCHSGFGPTLSSVQPVCPETPFDFKKSPVSFIGGAFFGYNKQIGNLVFGVEVDAGFKRGKASSTLTNTHLTPDPSTTTETFSGRIEQGFDSSLRVRFGTLVTPTTLVYLTAGATVVRTSGSFSYSACNVLASDGTVVCGGGSHTWNDTRVGYTAGFGTEIAIAQPFKIRFEYRCAHLPDFSKDVPLAVTSGPCTNCNGGAHIDMSAKSHTFRIGLAFDLGGV